MTRTTVEILRDALAHFQIMQSHAEQDLAERLVIDAVCMRLSAGIEALAALDPNVREEMFGEVWPLMWGMRNRIAHGYLLVDTTIIRQTLIHDVPSIMSRIRLRVDLDRSAGLGHGAVRFPKSSAHGPGTREAWFRSANSGRAVAMAAGRRSGPVLHVGSRDRGLVCQHGVDQPKGSAVVDVAAVVDAQNDDLASGIVDPIQHAVGAAAGGPHTGEFAAQHFPDSSRIGEQRAGHELDHRRRDRLRQAGLDGPHRGRGQHQVVTLSGDHGRRSRTASTPRTTSPAA